MNQQQSASPEHIFCRTCDHQVLAKAIVCTKCGCKPLDGKNYCYACGDVTNPKAIICIGCGVSLTQKSGIDLGILTNNDTVSKTIKAPAFWAPAVILISFFLPWFNMILFTVSGWGMRDMVKLVRVFEEGKANSSLMINAMYLLPFLAAGLIAAFFYSETIKNEKAINVCKVVTGLLPFLFFITLLSKKGNVIDYVSYGLYLTLAASACLLFDCIKNLSGSLKNIKATNLQASVQSKESVPAPITTFINEPPKVTIQKPLSEEDQALGYQLLEEKEKNKKIRTRLIAVSSIAAIGIAIGLLFFFNPTSKSVNGEAQIQGISTSDPAVRQVSEITNDDLQTKFGAETELSKVIPVDSRLIDYIISVEESVKGYKWEQDQIERFKKEARASYIHLDNDDSNDLLVQGDAGANVVGFWLFRGIGNTWKIVFSDRAHDLILNDTYTNNLKNITVVSATAAASMESTYAFDGKNYKPFECWQQDFTGGNTDRHKVTCETSETPNDGKPFTDLTNNKYSIDRQGILDAIRNPVQEKLKQGLKFQVNKIFVSGDYAFMEGVPKNANGGKVNYSKTEYQEQIEFGAFDDMIVALCKRDGASWKCIEYKIGCTDVCYEDWPEKYGFPKIMIGKTN